MKIIRLSFVFFWIIHMPLCIFAQKDTVNVLPDNRKVTGRIFANFYTGIAKGDKTSAFEVRRAYLGYKTQISRDFTAEVKLDIGSPNDLSEYSRIRRYAYFKTAALYYQHGKVFLSLGFSISIISICRKNFGITDMSTNPFRTNTDLAIKQILVQASIINFSQVYQQI